MGLNFPNCKFNVILLRSEHYLLLEQLTKLVLDILTLADGGQSLGLGEPGRVEFGLAVLLVVPEIVHRVGDLRIEQLLNCLILTPRIGFVRARVPMLFVFLLGLIEHSFLI